MGNEEPLIAVTVLKLSPAMQMELKAMAAEVGVPMGSYVKFLVCQHLKTPFAITLPTPSRKGAKQAHHHQRSASAS